MFIPAEETKYLQGKYWKAYFICCGPVVNGNCYPGNMAAAARYTGHSTKLAGSRFLRENLVKGTGKVCSIEKNRLGMAT